MPDVSGLECVPETTEQEQETQENEVKTQNAKVQESTEFTFHPRVSTASSRIVSNLGMDFYERQQKHMEKQKKVYDQMNLPSGQPGTKRAKFAAIHKENQENLKPRPTTGEASSLLSKRLSNTSKRKPTHHVTYMVTDQDMPRTPMPPTSSPPPLPPRSKTYYASASTTKGIARKRSMNDPYANMDRLQNAKLKAEKAIRNKKIFSIHGPYPLIRRALRERGWVEKEFKLPPRPAKPKERGDSSDVDDLDDDDYDDDDQKDSGIGMSPRPADSDEEKDDPDNKYGIMGRMVRNEVPMFQWTTRNSSIDWRFLQKDQLVNHYAKANFTTKVGLCMNLRTLSCFADVNVDTFFPRCYRLSQEEDKFDFIDDFRLVAATAILRVVVDRHGGEEQEGGGGDPEKISIGQKAPGGSASMVSADVLLLALRACQLYIKEREHDDIDSDSSVCKLPEESWNQLVQNYYKLVHEGATVTNSVSYQKQCEQTLEKISEINAQHQTDGIMNTWIVKPGAKSRGRGIVVMNRLDDILKLVQCDPTLMKDGRWVIQKYIERPLLIYGTKFDIRQWFLVTDWNPMTIWMYKACYLRFSSRPFSLKNLDPCIHLCNYSVQKNYEIDAKRHPMLPADNMWSSEDFQNYMKSRGCEALWDNLIYPGMRKAIIHMCQTAQDVVDYRKGSFEMYGADFMIDENYNPWLIEINSSPTMARSTPVTSKMCAMVQEDTLKVVLDRRKDRNCDCGLFELIHKQPTIDVPLYVGKSLQVEGATIKKPGGNGVRRSWGGNNTISTTQIPAPPKRPEATTVSHESKLFRTLSNHHSPYGPQRNQPRAPLKVQVVKTPPKPPPEAPSSPVRLKMQNTMKRLTNEVKATPSKPNALSLPRFASNTTLNSTVPHHHTVPKVLSHGNLSKNHAQNKAGVGSNHTGGVHCVSTTHAKAASAMGIIQNTHYSGLIAAANRGSLPMRVHQPLHQVIIPKTFPPSLVPGGDVVARGATMAHPLAPSGVMAVTPQTIGLALPLQKFFGGNAETPYGTTPRTRHMEIYNYPGQDFRFAGKQRVSGRLY